MQTSVQQQGWLDLLDDEDRALVKRFILVSGSLKKLAAAYQVTYPTIRLRLDRLIEKIKFIDEQPPSSDFESIARVQTADGKIDSQTLQLLLDAHHREIVSKG